MEFHTYQNERSNVHFRHFNTFPFPTSLISSLNRALVSNQFHGLVNSELVNSILIYLRRGKYSKIIKRILKEAVQYNIKNDWNTIREGVLENIFSNNVVIIERLEKIDEVILLGIREMIGTLNEIKPSPTLTFMEASSFMKNSDAGLTLGREIAKYSLKSSFNLAIRLAEKYEIYPLVEVEDVRIKLINVETELRNHQLNYEVPRDLIIPILTLDNGILNVNLILGNLNYTTLNSLISVSTTIPLSPLSLDSLNPRHVDYVLEYFIKLFEPRTVEGYPNKENRKRFCLGRGMAKCHYVGREDIYFANVYSVYSVLRTMNELRRGHKRERLQSLLLSILPADFPWGTLSFGLMEGPLLRRAGNEGDRA